MLAARLEKVEREVEKARDARSSLDGALAMLSELRSKVEADDWSATRRRVVEAFVAGVEIETHFERESPKRGKRTVTLRVHYRFETPELDDVAPQSPKSRTAKNPVVVMGLSVVRVHSGLSFAFDPFASARDAARELLRGNPRMFAKDVVARVLESTGETISPASISRLKSKLKRNGSYMGEGRA